MIEHLVFLTTTDIIIQEKLQFFPDILILFSCQIYDLIDISICKMENYWQVDSKSKCYLLKSSMTAQNLIKSPLIKVYAVHKRYMHQFQRSNLRDTQISFHPNTCFLLFLGGFESEKLKVEADGMWQAVFVTFLVYAMMPLKTWVALAFSTVVAATHISVSALLTTNQKVGLHWQQVRLILMCLNSQYF